VGGAVKGREGPAPEVHNVELHLLRGVGQAQRHDQAAQRRRLARQRAADHGHVAVGPGQVHLQRLPPLLQRQVHHTQRHPQAPPLTPGHGDQAQAGDQCQVRHEGVHGVRHLQGRQPHLVRGRALTPHAGYRDIDLGHALPALVPRHHRDRTGLLLAGGRGALQLQHRRGGKGQDLDRRRRGTCPHPADHPAGRRRSRHVGGPEADQLVRARLEVAHAGEGRQLVGVRHPQDVTGLRGGEGPQADPVGQVGVQSLQAPLLQALGGQQEVDGHGAPQASDRHKEVSELRLGAQQLGELVQDNEQGGHRGQAVAPRQPVRLVVRDVGVVARLAQQLLTAHHLPAQGLLHTVHQAQLGLQVGDHGRDVRQVGHAREGGPALEVHQDEVELLRGVSQGHGQHQGAQHLRLARARGPDEQAVGPHPHLRGLLNVQEHRGALRGHAEGDAQAVAPLPPPPLDLRVEIADITDVQQLHEVHGALGVGLALRGLGVGALLLAPGRHAPGHGLGLGDPHDVGYRQGRPAVPEDDLHGALVRPGAGVHEQAHGGRGGQRPPGGHEAHHAHPGRALGGAQAGTSWQGHAVDHQQDVRPGRHGVTDLERRPGGDVLPQQVGELHRIRGHHAGPAQGVTDLCGPGVRQPLDPLPLAAVLLGAQHRHPQQGGGHEGGQVADHGAHLGPGGVRLTAHLDQAELIEHDAAGHVVQAGVGGQEPAHGGVADYVRVGQGRQLRLDQLHGQLLGGGAHAHVEEVGRAGLPLPQPPAVLGNEHQGVRVRQVPAGEGALAGGHLPYRLTYLRQLAQVLPAQVADGAVVGTDLPVDVEADHGHHGHHHDPGHEQHARVLPLGHGHKDHDPHGPHHGDDGDQDIAHPSGLGPVRRGGQGNLPGRELGLPSRVTLGGLGCHRILLVHGHGAPTV